MFNQKNLTILLLLAAGCGGNAAAGTTATSPACNGVVRADNNVVIARDTLAIANANVLRLQNGESRQFTNSFITAGQGDARRLVDCVGHKWLVRLQVEIKHASP